MRKKVDGVRFFFVDETGDLTFFNKRGVNIVGKENISKFFMLGVVEIPNLEKNCMLLEDLRIEFLKNPYFKDIPSFQPEQGKLAIGFHASEDLPEVRWKVFELLKDMKIQVQVIIRRKDCIALAAKEAYKSLGAKLSENTIYDDLVMRLFRNLLHKADKNHIVFAKRGNSHRQIPLESAINKAKLNFEKKFDKKITQPTIVESALPNQFVGLQIVDYYLWALQRMYEKSDPRYFEFVHKSFCLVIDLDDKRHKEYGEYYHERNCLTAEKMKPVAG